MVMLQENDVQKYIEFTFEMWWKKIKQMNWISISARSWHTYTECTKLFHGFGWIEDSSSRWAKSLPRWSQQEFATVFSGTKKWDYIPFLLPFMQKKPLSQ